MALHDLSVRIGADTTGFQRGMRSITSGIKSLVASAASIAGVTLGVKGLVQAFKSYVSLESGVRRVSDLFGESAKYIDYFATTTAKSLGMAETAAYQYAATYGNLFKNITASTDENAKVTIAMLKASSVVASKTGRSMEDVMERIRSGLLGNTEAIEDLGIYVNVAMLETTEAFKKIADGRSWEQLQYYEQQQIRTLAILEQANNQFGTEVQQGSAYSLSVLSGAFKDLMSVIGSFVNQALQPVVAWLTKITQTATGALKSLSALMGFNISADTDSMAGGFDSSAASSGDIADNMSDTAKSAKDIKKQLAGFDELNILAKPEGEESSASSGVASGGASVFDALPELEYQEMVIDTSKTEKSLEKIRKKVKSVWDMLKKWSTVSFGSIFSGIFEGLKTETAELSGIFADIFGDLISLAEPLKAYFAGDFTSFLQSAFTLIGTILVGLFDTFNRVFSDIWNIAVFPCLSSFIELGLPVITQFLSQVAATLTVLFEQVKSIFDMLWQDVAVPVLELFTQIFTDLWESVSKAWDKWGQPVFDNIREAIESIGDTFKNMWNKFLKPIFDKFMEVVTALWEEHLKPLVDNFLDFVGELINGGLEIYNEFILPVVNWFINTFGPPISKVFGMIIETIGNVIGAIVDAVNGIITTLKGVVQFITGVFTGDWEKAWEGIKTIFKGVWDTFESIVNIPLNLIIDLINGLTSAIESALNWIIDGLNSAFSIDIPDNVPVVGGTSFSLGISNVEIPEIPHLATGGIIEKPTIAMIGEAGTEAIVPLENNTGWMDRIADRISASIQQTGASGDIHVHAELDGREIGRFCIRAVELNKAYSGG